MTALSLAIGGGADVGIATWHADWAWGLPLIVLNVVIHVLGLGLINEQIVTRVSRRLNPPRLTASFVVIMAAATLLSGIARDRGYRLGGSL
jgi:hypothetical protein